MSGPDTPYSRARVWDAIGEIADRWGIPRESARLFLAGQGYFRPILSRNAGNAGDRSGGEVRAR